MKTDRVTNLLVVSIVLTIVCGGIKYYNTVQKKITMQWVMHTYVVMHETSGVLTQLLEAQVGQRNFLFTGDSTYLRTYYASVVLELKQ